MYPQGRAYRGDGCVAVDGVGGDVSDAGGIGDVDIVQTADVTVAGVVVGRVGVDT